MSTEQILNILVCFYYFLDIYMFVYSQELRIRSYYDSCDNFVRLDCIEPVEPMVSSTGKDSIVEMVSVEESREYSELDAASLDLFAELQQELELGDSLSKQTEVEEIVYVMDDELDYEMDFVSEWAEEELDDCIQMADLEIEDNSEPTGYEAFASSKIADKVNGPQQWVVSVIGMEESYIHVSDGKRLWINVGERAAKLNNGDVLILDVIRNGKEVVVENLIRIETSVSEEYEIPDEIHFYQDERIAM